MICLSSPPVITLLHCSFIHMDVTAPGKQNNKQIKMQISVVLEMTEQVILREFSIESDHWITLTVYAKRNFSRALGGCSYSQ